MRVLLINPPNFNHIKSVLPEVVEEERGCNPPLGLLYLAGYLQKYSPQIEIKIMDCLAEKLNYLAIEENIKIFNPDVVGISVMSFTLIDVLKIARLIKQTRPETTVVFGGPHVNIYGEETLRLGLVDYIVLAEGERIFNELVNNLNNQEYLKNIKGLIFFDNKNNLINTGWPEFIFNLDEIPLPARNLINNGLYSSILGTGELITTMMTSRGCPYKCLFCDRPQMGKVFRARSADNVLAEIKDCLKYGIKEFLMYDDTFTVDRQRVLNICNQIIDQKLNIRWDIRARINTIDQEILEKLKQAGCVRIHYGVESGTQKILDVLKKGIILEQVEKVFKLTQKIGIETLAYFMIGNPTETREDIEKTIAFAKKIKPDYVHITATVPFPATDLYHLALQEGVIKYDVWQEFAKNPDPDFILPLWEKELTARELYQYIQKAYRGFYFRPSYILKRLLSLKSWNEFKIKIRAGLKMLKI